MSNGERSEWLVSTDELAGWLDDPDLRLFDCTVHLVPNEKGGMAIESGAATYGQAHIPGAAFADLAGDLSDGSNPLPFTMPDAQALADAFGRLGVSNESRVVLYSQAHPMWATRVWWILRALGFDKAAVLDGGLTKWRAEGRPLSTEAHGYAPDTLAPRHRPEMIASKEDMLSAIGARDTCIVNALGKSLHKGEGPSPYGRVGRIASSVNLPAAGLIDPATGAFHALDTLRTAFAAIGADKATRVVTYCGGGIAATADAFVLSLLGYDNVALYDNSMSEWARDPDLPMETG